MVDRDQEIQNHRNLQNMFHLPRNGKLLHELSGIFMMHSRIVKQERRSRSSSKPSRSKSPKKAVKQQKSKKDAKKKSKRKRKSSTSSSSNSSSDSESESKPTRKELLSDF